MTPLRTLALTLALALPGMARADCPTKDDLAAGIVFTRQDGRSGIVSSTDGKTFTIDYAASEPFWTDKRLAIFGIYETYAQILLRSEIVVGVGGSTQINLKISGTPPLPEPGGSWKTRIRSIAEWDDGTENGHHRKVERVAVTYHFLPAIDITLSGCTYAVIPVEAELLGEGTPQTRRWIYFPTLGFGLETKVGDTPNGLTSLKANG